MPHEPSERIARLARWGWWQAGVAVAAIGLANGLIPYFMPAWPLPS